MGYAQRFRQREHAMMRRVTFDDSPQHKVYFRLLYEAFRSRGSAPDGKRVSKEEKRTDAKILRALKLVSEPIGEEPAAGELDGRTRKLLDVVGGALELEQPEFKRLQTYVEDTQWMAAMTDVAADLEDWLDTAEKVEPEKADKP